MAEDSILGAAKQKLQQWRSHIFSKKEIVETEKSLAQYALSVLHKAYKKMITIVENKDQISLPGNFVLYQNYPNPFNSSTTIQFTIPQPSFVSLKVYNLLGEEITSLNAETFEMGTHGSTYKMNGISSGVYFYRIEVQSVCGDKKTVFTNTKKFNLTK